MEGNNLRPSGGEKLPIMEHLENQLPPATRRSSATPTVGTELCAIVSCEAATNRWDTGDIRIKSQRQPELCALYYQGQQVLHVQGRHVVQPVQRCSQISAPSCRRPIRAAM